MLKKFKVLVIIISVAVTLSLMSNTYSRYVASSEGNLQIEFAKWQLLVNNTDITNQTNSSISFEPTIESNQNIAENKIAPSSTGYFDIEIDPTNVDVSFKYNINLDLDNTNIPDLSITKYALIPEDYSEGDAVEFRSLENGEITDIMTYSNDGFKKFTIRVYFQWLEGENETMDNTADTNVGLSAADENTTFTISANINFEQYLG